MGSHAGLKKVVKTVKGKKGVVKRSYWVRAKEAVSGLAKRQGRANAAAYKKSSTMGSAKTGLHVGLVGGLLGAHRTGYGVDATHVGSQMLAAGTRRATGTQGKTIGKKIKHGLATYAGTTGGMILGGMAHEMARGIGRGAVAAYRNRRAK